jgi:uncharacterized protein YgbK (DUF1537 family)
MSSRQLAHLLAHADVQPVELHVGRLLFEDRRSEIELVMGDANRSVGAGRDTVVYTSRELVTGDTAEESIRIQAVVASALIEIVRGISAAPRYVLAKGGITSHDIAAKALGVLSAIVMGQILPGVPVWRLGEGSRFPGMSYIVFPGNVGGETAMTDVVQALKASASPRQP